MGKKIAANNLIGNQTNKQSNFTSNLAYGKRGRNDINPRIYPISIVYVLLNFHFGTYL